MSGFEPETSGVRNDIFVPPPMAKYYKFVIRYIGNISGIGP